MTNKIDIGFIRKLEGGQKITVYVPRDGNNKPHSNSGLQLLLDRIGALKAD